MVCYGTGGMCVDALVCQGKVMERDAQRTIEKKRSKKERFGFLLWKSEAAGRYASIMSEYM